MSFPATPAASTHAASSSSGTFTTPGIDTSGCDLIVVCYGAADDAGVLSDNKGNTFQTAIDFQPTGGFVSVIKYIKSTGTFGAGHTFTLTGAGEFGDMQVWAWSGSKTSADPLDAGQTNSDLEFGSTTAAPGPITPSVNGCLVITHVNHHSGSGVSINSGYSAILGDFNGSNNIGSHSAYLVQSVAASTDPTWTTLNNNLYSTIASFLPSSGGGGGGSKNGSSLLMTGVGN